MSEWISVKERLPERWQNVLAYRKNKKVRMEFICSNGEWEMDDACMPSVTHWMPIPEPPKEG